MPNLYIISGCNGAGKTTASYTILPEMLNCKEFVNADEIAKGLSPFQPERVSIESGRIMLRRIDELIQQHVDFAFETTLSARHFVGLIKKAQSEGYFVTLIFFWLDTVELAKERVMERVKDGGHNIPEQTIEKRYQLGIKNLINLYISQIDYWLIVDNSRKSFQIIAEGLQMDNLEIYNEQIWTRIKTQAHE